MRAYVITIMDNPQSVEVADRCIRHSSWYNINIKHWPATTPRDNLEELFEKEGIRMDGFIEKYSRPENCAAAFFSHYSLWKQCIEDDETFVIFEHDAVLNNSLPTQHFDYLMNIGAPSYGKHNTPTTLGVNPLCSKGGNGRNPYMPGAHAYMLKPEGARRLVAQAKIYARPTDVFMNLEDFPWIQEYYPWPATARDTFTTIQREVGTMSKHNKVEVIRA